MEGIFQSTPDGRYLAANPALARIGIYLLIPLGSWAGAALVERLLDHFLG